MLGPASFGPTPIRSPAGHACTYEETERRLAPLLDRVPVTRVYDATALDYVGLPVCGAVTPLAADLTVHGGKGPTVQAARVSAVMEAIERVCAEDIEPERQRRAPFHRVAGEGALEPELFDLPFQTSYTPTRPISWVEGYDLLAARPVWVASDLVISPASEGVCLGVETNGLAAGNTCTEAVLHALCELIERDALSTYGFVRRYCDLEALPPDRIVDPESLPAGVVGTVRGLADRGLSVTLEDLTHDLDVPVFQATIWDRDFPGADGRLRRFAGLGCDLDVQAALGRALSEAAQTHTTVLLGARDAIEGGRPENERGADRIVRQLLAASCVVPLREAGTPPADLWERLLLLLERLVRAGFRHCVVVDLTRSDLEVPVVRVLVPGLAGPFGESSRRPTARLLRHLV